MIFRFPNFINRCGIYEKKLVNLRILKETVGNKLPVYCKKLIKKKEWIQYSAEFALPEIYI